MVGLYRRSVRFAAPAGTCLRLHLGGLGLRVWWWDVPVRWCELLCDNRSFVGAGQIRSRPRGFNCAGLVDEWRRPKLAYDAVCEAIR